MWGAACREEVKGGRPWRPATLGLFGFPRLPSAWPTRLAMAGGRKLTKPSLASLGADQAEENGGLGVGVEVPGQQLQVPLAAVREGQPEGALRGDGLPRRDDEVDPSHGHEIAVADDDAGGVEQRRARRERGPVRGQVSVASDEAPLGKRALMSDVGSNAEPAAPSMLGHFTARRSERRSASDTARRPVRSVEAGRDASVRCLYAQTPYAPRAACVH